MARAPVAPCRSFTDEPLLAIVEYLRAQLDAGCRVVQLRVPDPASGPGLYAGERVTFETTEARHRSFRTWVDLADRMDLRLHALRPTAEDSAFVILEFHALAPEKRFRGDPSVDPTERYGDRSDFQRIEKSEDPDLILDLSDALDRAALPEAPRVLDLGVNTGEELALLSALVPRVRDTACFVGFDHSASAIATARERFADPRHRFVHADLSDLRAHDLGRFDLVLSLNTLHSPAIDDRAVLRELVQHHLEPQGSLIIGFPNCIYVDGEIRFGARMRNFHQPDLSVIIKEVAFYRRYLQQHRRRVFITGKYHLLVTAIPIGARTTR